MKTNHRGSIKELYIEAANSYTHSDISALEETIADKTSAITEPLKESLEYGDFTKTKASIDALVNTISQKAFEVGFRKGATIALDVLLG